MAKKSILKKKAAKAKPKVKKPLADLAVEVTIDDLAQRAAKPVKAKGNATTGVKTPARWQDGFHCKLVDAPPGRLFTLEAEAGTIGELKRLNKKSAAVRFLSVQDDSEFIQNREILLPLATAVHVGHERMLSVLSERCSSRGRSPEYYGRKINSRYLVPLDRVNDGERSYQVLEVDDKGVKIRVILGPGEGEVLEWPHQPVALGMLNHVPQNVAAKPKASKGQGERKERATSKRGEREPPKDRMKEPPAAIVNKTGIPVEWTGANGKHRVKIWEHAMRSLVRWCGFKGWEDGQILLAMKMMGLGEYPSLPAIISDHARSGKQGDAGCHGAIPKLTSEQEKAMNKLKK